MYRNSFSPATGAPATPLPPSYTDVDHGGRASLPRERDPYRVVFGKNKKDDGSMGVLADNPVKPQNCPGGAELVLH